MREQETSRTLPAMTPATQPRALDAFHVMTKPIGPVCNLNCRYCFYLEKKNLYPANERFKMTEAVLEKYIRDYIGAHGAPEVHFAWQGGEPTLIGLDFFRKTVELQARHAGGKRICNALQTNGTLLDDEWGRFLSQNRFLVGLSLDGPRELHDAYRRGLDGGPTFDRVMRGLDVLKQHRVDFNTLTVVHRANAGHPLEVYHFLKEIGSEFIQFIPLVERLPDAESRAAGLNLAEPPAPGKGRRPLPVARWSVEAGEFGEFLASIFDEWVRRDVGRVFVQMFDAALGSWAGAGATLCVFAERCGDALAMEHNGDVFACDHYVYPEYRRGNVLERSLKEMLISPAQRKFGDDKLNALPDGCRQCEVRFACNGGCPKHRFIRIPDGARGLNYLCAGYRRFFRHIDPYMKTMANLLRMQQPPADIMRLLEDEEKKQRMQKAGRNAPCPCGSGRKFKHCCAAVVANGFSGSAP